MTPLSPELSFGSSSSSSSISLTIIFSLFSSLLLSTIDARLTLPYNATVPALIVFGDSIVDSGNNNNLATLVKCNFSPYGKDFMGGIPTGRFSNGKIPSDLIADSLGIKQLLPAYLDPNLRTEDLLTGVTFASGGTGFDPLTPKVAAVLSLSKQLELFKEYVGRLNLAVGEERSATIISESMYIVCAGSDDLANTYFTTPFRKLSYDVPSYTDLMLQSASSFVQELYGLGARRIGLISIPPIGCVPSQRTLGGGKDRSCAENYNEAAKLFNTKLSSELNSLKQQLPQSRLVYIDVYYRILDIIQRPQNYGFEVINKGCCGTGKIEVAVLCNDLDPLTCLDVSNYVFWDSYHPTEKAYRSVVEPVLSKHINEFF
ncbi:PREDICTED: GDSL esterase/lipase EXL3-like [Nelumbo nucifera]|uniref:GDSL esterase/lipase EXL3-like n=2 Tax=Nelumbo nucifera TaxID=4432 RepID=A0A1U8Q8U4_NELNU|nr:PREDICTED: GDSL esterase/lipase EXL3-like [Nelumbo nucifera]DAD46756.1 TPA_asm: hypothetical protein HUJ06_016693 [Nelumbo nucifera]